MVTRSSWLLSSGGRRGALVHLLRQQRDFAPERVVVSDASRLSAAGRLADEFEIVPRVLSDEFITETLRISRKHHCSIVIPTIDPEIEVYAKARDEFSRQGTDVWVSSQEVSRIGWDKWELYQWLRRTGFPTMETQEVRNVDSALMTGKVVAKPRTGSSSIGVIIADSLGGLGHDVLADDYIVQAFAPGIEVTVDVGVDRWGRVLATIPRRRLEVRAGEVSKGVTISASEIEELVRDLVTRLPGAYGILNVQVIYDPTTKALSVLEINPRIGGGYPLSHAAGGDLIGSLLRGTEGSPAPVHWRPGEVMLRFDDATFFLDGDYAVNPWR
jgi:carbamoyl-phosphate synthase large subunit